MFKPKRTAIDTELLDELIGLASGPANGFRECATASPPPVGIAVADASDLVK